MSANTVASAKAKSRIEISRRAAADHKALEAMYEEVFGSNAAEENRARWKWQYDENPHCPEEGPEIWVAKEQGEILGQYASMPVRLKVGDRTLKASWGMDVMVRPQLQRKGVGSRLFLFWDQNVEASLGLGLSAASYTLFKKLFWNDVGPVPCYSKILDPDALVRRRLGVLATITSPLLRLGLWLIFPERTTRSMEGIEVRALEGPFHPAYDDLWEKASERYDFIAERTAIYLEWKYRKIPYVSYDIFEAWCGEKLTGYIVLRMTERSGVRLALLVDWLAHPEDSATLGALLDQAFSWARERGAARMQTFTFDRRLAGRLQHKGFMRIESPMQFCVRIHSDHVDDNFVADTTHWHVTFGDSDQDREV